MSSLTTTLDTPRVLDRTVTDLTVVNTAVETTIYTATIAGNSLSTNRMLRLTLIGEYLNNSGATRNLTIKVKFGGTTIWEDEGPAAADIDRRAISLRVELVNQDATNDQVGGGSFFLGDPGTATTGISPLTTAANLHSIMRSIDTAIDTTVDQTFEVTWTHEVANASLEFKRRFAVLEVV